MRWASLLLAHAVATAVFAAVTFVLTAVAYVGLLLWAVFAGEAIGGPLGLLAMLLAALVYVPVMIALLLAPATTLARGLRHALSWSWWTEIPLATGSMVLLVGIAYVVIGLQPDSTAFDAAGLQTAGVFAAAALLPLGLYWWVFTAVDGGVRGAHAGVSRLVALIRQRAAMPA